VKGKASQDSEEDSLLTDLAHPRSTSIQPSILQPIHNLTLCSLHIIIALGIKIHIKHINNFTPLGSEVGRIISRVSGSDESSRRSSICFGAESSRPCSVILNETRCGFSDLSEFLDRFALYGFTGPLSGFTSFEDFGDFLYGRLSVEDVELPDLDTVNSGFDVGDELIQVGLGVEGSWYA